MARNRLILGFGRGFEITAQVSRGRDPPLSFTSDIRSLCRYCPRFRSGNAVGPAVRPGRGTPLRFGGGQLLTCHAASAASATTQYFGNVWTAIGIDRKPSAPTRSTRNVGILVCRVTSFWSPPHMPGIMIRLMNANAAASTFWAVTAGLLAL